jgi:hypothetical protein
MESTFNCNVCLERFNEFDHVPYILGCGHTFCKQCLLKPLNDLRRSYEVFMRVSTDDSKKKLQKKMKCFSRCPDAFKKDDTIDTLYVNRDLLNLIKSIPTPTTTDGSLLHNPLDFQLTIGLVPANLDKEKFEQHFLT